MDSNQGAELVVVRYIGYIRVKKDCIEGIRNYDLFFFQAEDGIRDLVRSRGLGDVYKRQLLDKDTWNWGEWTPRTGDADHGLEMIRTVTALRLSLIHI